MASKNTEKIVTGKRLLINWANQQDHWIRAMVTEVVNTQTTLSDSQIDQCYTLLLIEKGLHTGEQPDIPFLTDQNASSENEQVLTLAQIADVENVNCLASGQQLRFNPRLTVIFGENAAGKSGYARILKSLAAVRTPESILSDVFKPQRVPSANISYWLGAESNNDIAKAISIRWQGEQGLAPLTRIDVFDSRGVGVHVDNELSYIYTPSDLSLFPLVLEAVDRVKSKLEKARMDASSATNHFTAVFNPQSNLYSKIEKLGPSTDIEELRIMATVSIEEEASLPDQEAKVSALRSASTDATLTVAVAEKDWLVAVQECAAILANFDVKSYNNSVAALTQAKAAYKATSETAFATESIPGFGAVEWTNFIEAGETYEAAATSTYPEVGDSCPYCHQNLSEEAKKLLTKYRDYCSNEARKSVTAALNVLQSIVQPLQEIELIRISEETKKRAEENANADADWKKSLAESFKKAIEAKILVDKFTVLPSDSLNAWQTIVAEVRTRLSISEANIVSLQAQGDERKKAFDEELKNLLNLKDRLQLRNNFSAVSNYVNKCQWAERANNVGTKFRSLSTGLTALSKTASEQLINQDFEKLFEKECNALKAPTVTLDFSGKKGQAARKKTLVAGHKLSDILSEGEQKVIALADFIAETSLRRKSSPIVFDDPVNSLDYKRLKQVVRRFYELSKTRQIIIFTHNIWFATELLDCFIREKKACTYYDIRSEDGRRGLLSQANNPRMDVFDSYKKQIDDIIRQASNQQDETIKEALVKSGYDVLRGACEIFVETDLFQEVTRRYRANIMMTKLSAIRPERLPAAIKTVEEIFDKCCDVMWGHSHGGETANIRPSFEELKSEWEQLKAARELYLAGEKTA